MNPVPHFAVIYFIYIYISIYTYRIHFVVHLVKPGALSSDRAFRFRASRPYLPALCCAASFPSCAAQYSRNCELMNEAANLESQCFRTLTISSEFRESF